MPSKFRGASEWGGDFFSHIHQDSHNSSVRRTRKTNISFMFTRKPKRPERVCYADIMNRLPRRIIDRDMIMPAACAFASGSIDRLTMMRWINAEGPRWDDDV